MKDRWCAGEGDEADPPTNLALQNLVRLLRGQALLSNHCYKTTDLQMMMRLMDEFGFKVASFHHAHEAYEIAPQRAERDIVAALFDDQYAYKMEAIEGSGFFFFEEEEGKRLPFLMMFFYDFLLLT